MPFDAPFRLGPFLVDETGRLSPGAPDLFPSFSICWRDRVLHARLAQPPAPGSERGSLGIEVLLGRVPSTADGATGPARREDAFAVLSGLPAVLPSGWRMALLADHRIRFELEVGLELPTSAVALVSEVTMLLLELAPYLDVLDEAGVAPVPRSAAGMANTWPG